MKKRLALNTASNVGTLFLKLGITFVMTPILVSNLGRYDYGLWEMVMAIIGYMGILSMGIRPTVSRFAAQYLARGDEGALSEVYATAWFYLMAVGSVIGISIICWGLFFPDILAENTSDTQTYTLFLLILGAQLMLVFPAYTAESFMEAYQEYYLKNNITIVNSVLGAVAIYHFITPSNALVLLMGVNATGVSIKYLFYVYYIQRKGRFLRPFPNRFSWRRLKQLFTFSIKTVVQGISTKIENATDSLVIGFILGPATVPLYSIPANLVNYIRMISYNLTHVFMPYFSSLNATNERDKTRRIYLFGSKLTVCIVAVMVIGVSVLGQKFLQLWIGGDIAEGAAPIILLLVAFTALPLLNPYSGRYLTAIDRHGVFAKWGPVVAFSNLALSLLLIQPLGIFGVALGSLIPGLIYQPFILWYCCRELELSVIQYLKAVLLPIAVPAAAMLSSLLYLNQTFEIESYTALLAIAAVSTFVFCVLANWMSLTAAERRELWTILATKKPN